MPLVYVQRYAPPTTYLAGGTQYVEGALSFAGATTIYLSNDVYGATGSYVLFEYGSFTLTAPYTTELDVLNNLVTVDSSALVLSSFQSWTVDTIAKQVIMNLGSNPTNGCQFVDGVLDISNPIDVYLSSTLYATAGTYTLFDWSGGGSFTGSASNITIYPPGGLNVAVTPYVDGNTIKFTLV